MSSQKGNKKSFYRCLHSTVYRKCGPGERNTQKTEVSQATETSRKVCSKKDLPLVEENQLQEHLNKPGTHKSMGPDGIDKSMLCRSTHAEGPGQCHC